MPLSKITSQVNSLLPNYCYLATGKLSDYQNELASIELKYIDECSPSRKNEFRAGRSIAKEAANFLGVEILSITKDSNGCPLWPDPVVGSISHKAGFCGALLGCRGTYSSIGLDIELVEHLQEDVWKIFAAAHEIEQANTCNMEASVFANLIFSAKEAFFKCLYPLYYPSNPTLPDIAIMVEPISHSYFETQITFDNKKFHGGIVFDSKILISWALIKNH